MLARGNHKLGGRLIRSFSLPSARPEICTGMSGLCREHCYARRLELFRPAVLARSEANHRLSLSPPFSRRVRAFLVGSDISVVRLHVGGDFYSSSYARKGLRIMKRSPHVRFYFYTRAWRDSAMRVVLERMAGLPTAAPGTPATARLKRGPVMTAFTRLANRSRQEGVNVCRILSCMGMRAQESPARAKKKAFSRNGMASNGRREVDDWLPLHAWTVEQVWSRIKASGVRHHPAYDVGMPRLSCCFCIFSPRSALLLSGKHNPEPLAEYVRVEQKIDHRFRLELPWWRSRLRPHTARSLAPSATGSCEITLPDPPSTSESEVILDRASATPWTQPCRPACGS